MSNLIIDNNNILNYWDYYKNNLIKLYPEKTTNGSGLDAWWRCEKGHSWQQRITTMTHKKENYCTICKNYKNSIYAKHPEVVPFWDFDKNVLQGYDIKQMASASNKKVFWKCELGHSWTATVDKVANQKRRCNICASKKVLKGFNDLTTTAPYLLKWWDYDKNILKPDQLTKGSHKTIFWKCKNNHSFKKEVLLMNKNPACGICSGHIIVSGVNDITTLRPDFLDWWDYDKNTLNPKILSPWTHKRFWVKCPKGHSWETTGDKMSTGYRCARCVKPHKISKKEKLLAGFVESLGFDIISGDRSIIYPLELDIVVPEKNMAIEFNGDYWHSDEVIKTVKNVSAFDYHKNKFDLAKGAGFNLVFVWESDWNKDELFIKKVVKDFLFGGVVDTVLLKFDNK